MRKVVVVLAAILMTAWLALGAPTCAGVGNVLNLEAGGCDFGDKNFSNFIITTVGLDSILMGIGQESPGGTEVVGSSVNLGFQLVHSPAPVPQGADVKLFYTVRTLTGASSIDWVDLFNGGSNVTIQEVVCGNPFVSGSCDQSLLVDMTVPSHGRGVAMLMLGGVPVLEDVIYIKKDIMIGPGGFISDFVNSHHQVPEPLSLLLMGSGLLGLGALRWRKKS
jgi:hypothetical protein